MNLMRRELKAPERFLEGVEEHGEESHEERIERAIVAVAPVNNLIVLLLNLMRRELKDERLRAVPVGQGGNLMRRELKDGLRGKEKRKRFSLESHEERIESLHVVPTQKMVDLIESHEERIERPPPPQPSPPPQLRIS